MGESRTLADPKSNMTGTKGPKAAWNAGAFGPFAAGTPTAP